MKENNLLATPWKPLWWNDQFYSHLRIWNRLNPWGCYDQRHEWKYKDGKTYFEDWIITSFKNPAKGAGPYNEKES